MRNRNYFIQRLTSLQSMIGRIKLMVSNNESPATIKKELGEMDERIEDILTQVEREPLSGNEINKF
jgi:archaellum component FlaC